ncbi:MAG: hypothetical protein ACJ72Z_12300 [Pyrinomonadaceae bacterium]
MRDSDLEVVIAIGGFSTSAGRLAFPPRVSEREELHPAINDARSKQEISLPAETDRNLKGLAI